MDIWKITTGFFAILAAVGFYLFFNANGAADRANLRLKTQREKSGALQAASTDASALVTWYRTKKDGELSARDYEKQVKILHDKFLNHFPGLANTGEPAKAENNGEGADVEPEK